MRNILVTGANGFVGGRIAARLAKDDYHVRALVRRPGEAEILQQDRITEVEGSFLDSTDMQRALEGIDAVVHAAATAGPDLDHVRSVNTEGTRTVAHAAITARLNRFVHVSTSSVYRRALDEDVVTEDSPKVGDDADPYSLTKWEAEQEVQAAITDGLKAVILRPPAVLGYAPTSTWGHRMPESIAKGEPLMTPPRGLALAYVHVDDFADAVARALAEAGAAGHTYNIATGTVPFRQYADEIASWVDAEPLDLPDEPAWSGVISSERARTELGWTPTRTYEEAMAESRRHWTSGDDEGSNGEG